MKEFRTTTELARLPSLSRNPVWRGRRPRSTRSAPAMRFLLTTALLRLTSARWALLTSSRPRRPRTPSATQSWSAHSSDRSLSPQRRPRPRPRLRPRPRPLRPRTYTRISCRPAGPPTETETATRESRTRRPPDAGGRCVCACVRVCGEGARGPAEKRGQRWDACLRCQPGGGRRGVVRCFAAWRRGLTLRFEHSTQLAFLLAVTARIDSRSKRLSADGAAEPHFSATHSPLSFVLVRGVNLWMQAYRLGNAKHSQEKERDPSVEDLRRNTNISNKYYY
jgi:hypothetical protein